MSPASAEALVGVARGLGHVIMLTLGTGVGGGIVIDGRIYRGATGYGGELGHMVVAEDGPPCQGHCPNHGCLEVMASAVGVMLAAQAIADRHPDGTLAAARTAGTLDVHHVIERGLTGEAECVEALAVVGRHLGVGISNYINIFNPQAVVVGGGISAAGELVPRPGARRGRAAGAAGTAARGHHRAGEARQHRRGAGCRRADPLVSGRLTVCPTPIGNLGDITVRVIEALRSADVIACEDTRRTATLCAAHGISTRLMSLHEHNEQARAPELVERIAAGGQVALVSDAGMPLVSDPGARLVAAVLDAGLELDVLPGASAVTTAIATSGLAGGGSCSRGSCHGRLRRARRPCSVSTRPGCLWWCSSRRSGCRPRCARSASVIPSAVRRYARARRAAPRGRSGNAHRAGRAVSRRPPGEITLVLQAVDAPAAQVPLDALSELAGTIGVRQAAELGARLTGAPRNQLYRTLTGR